MKSKKFRIYKARGNTENFSKRKLFSSLKHSGLPNKQCLIITEKVSRQVAEGANTKDIYNKTLRLVKNYSHLAAIHYSLKKALFDLGPSGHYFESFVARYFEKLGYQTKTCLSFQGRLVRHEVDVIAEKNGLVTFVECKFHNRIGIKNDIKTVLYVKARWDDLKEGVEGKHLESFVLASNTAFSLDAITYADGTGLKLLGVNAPKEKSFLDEIKSMRLYPITSLRRLSKSMKQTLLEKDIILAVELQDNIELLLKLGMQVSDINSLLYEIELLKDSKL